MGQGFARRGVLNQILCFGVACFLQVLGRSDNTFAVNWLYSASIGSCCWLFIDGGRLLLARGLDIGAPRSAPRRWPGAAWMLVCVVLGTLAGYSLGSSIGDAISGEQSPSLLSSRAVITISFIAAIAATSYFYTTDRLRQEAAATESARRIAAENQLRLLESQLEPHMLFNTLANLRVLIAGDPPRALAMLDQLIGFLRATLGASRVAHHPLSAEFARIGDYLALMQVRMGARLETRFDLPSDLADHTVPALLLQPLVENAIKHGLEGSIAGGRVEVRASRSGSELELEVRDTGSGLGATTANAGSHFGLLQVRERLATLYGTRATLTLTAADDAAGGTLATVRLPIETTPPRPRTPN